MTKNFGMHYGHISNYNAKLKQIVGALKLSWIVQLLNYFGQYSSNYGRIVLSIFFIFFLNRMGYAAVNSDTSISTAIPMHANWVFSGMVSTENGENIGYFFQMQRNGKQFHAISALLDEQSKQILLFDESEATLQDAMLYNWQVGRAFMRFNPINNSWIFGLKTLNNKGFNFKIDHWNIADKNQAIQNVSPGVKLLINQTSHLNGHIQAGNETKEQFVTAKNAWFRQLWLTKDQQNEPHSFTGTLCGFNDGSGFYSLNMTNLNTSKKLLAERYDPQGKLMDISKSFKIQQDASNDWHIEIAAQHLQFILSNHVKKDMAATGFVKDAKVSGFCTLLQNTIG